MRRSRSTKLPTGYQLLFVFATEKNHRHTVLDGCERIISDAFEDKMKQLQMFGEDCERNAIRFLQKHIGDDTAFVGFSGGKDSVATAKLCEMAGIKHELYYSLTGIDPPEVVRFIRQSYQRCRFLRPTMSFWKKLESNVPPSGRLRWCCDFLKKSPAKNLPHTKRVMGIRAEESPARAKYGKINGHFNGHVQFYPIFRWKEWQVWDFIKKHGLKTPPLYEWGFDRIGCVICPYHSEPTGIMHSMYREKWPTYFRRFEKTIANLWEKRVSQGRKMFYSNPKEFCEAWYKNDCARWYAVENGDEKQLKF